MLQTRLELAAVELEEESLRFFAYFLFALTAFFCFGLAILLAVLLIVAVFWDTHRMEVLLGLIAFFSISGLLIGFGIRNHYRKKPRLLENTLSELNHDLNSLGLVRE